MHTPSCRYYPGSVGRRVRHSCENDIAVFVCPCVQKSAGQFSVARDELVAFTLQVRRLLLQLLCVLEREPADHRIYGTLELLAAVDVAVEKAHAERAKPRHYLVAQDS